MLANEESTGAFYVVRPYRRPLHNDADKGCNNMRNRKRKYKEKNYGVRKRTYIFMMIIVGCVYLAAQHFYDWERLTETVATIIAIIAAVAFWLEYRETKVLNEAQFIMELNEQFLGDPNLSAVEWELEKYYTRYRNDELTLDFLEEFERQFDINDSKRQSLVNYLVHLEGITALVNSGVLRLDAIDNLMSYRYFVAVNNPIVRKLELCDYADYYKGCHSIYNSWVDLLKKKNVKIPMYNEGEHLGG